MSACDDKQDEFLKNEYILNLNELIMTRNYIYKGLLGLAWTALLLIGLFFAEKHEKE